MRKRSEFDRAVLKKEIFGIELVGSDTKRDVALLKLPDHQCSPLPLGDSDAIQPGERIVVLGNHLRGAIWLVPLAMG